MSASLKFSVDTPVPFDIFFPKGMLNPKEHRLLYFMGKNFLTKGGSLVDLGTFVGASSFCLVRGALDSSEFVLGHQPLHCFDKFTIDKNPNIEKFLSGAFLTSRHTSGREIASGVEIEALKNSFLPVFKFQCGQYIEHIKIYEGDIFEFVWEGEHIDAVNVDIGKTKEIYNHVLRHFFPYVRTGGAIYQQDYYISVHYYLAVSMHLLSDYVEVMADHFGGGVLYRLKKPIEQSKLKEVIETLENLTVKELSEIVSQLSVTKGRKGFVDLCWAFGMLDLKPDLESCETIEQRIPAVLAPTENGTLTQFLRNTIFTIRKKHANLAKN